MPKLIDAHIHVQFPQFNKDRDEIIKRAFDNEIWIINAGADYKSSVKAVELSQKYPNGVFATVGRHPTAKETYDFQYNKFLNLAENKKVVAIGECGLDYYYNPQTNAENIENQKRLFIEHIKLAKEVKKPLMIHCREAFPDLIKILIANYQLLIADRPGIFHFFTGALNDAKKLLEMGFYFTFGGLITFNREFDEIIKHIPMDRILTETDAPYVAPAPYRGQRNEPAYVIEVAKKMAEIKNISFEEIAKITIENAKRIFNIF
ncbi:MAG: TatD family hydrolase [Patescibacteria group bacterium]|nr:TatD family hydrolase [Patescibacteria group bacterium]